MNASAMNITSATIENKVTPRVMVSITIATAKQLEQYAELQLEQRGAWRKEHQTPKDRRNIHINEHYDN